VGNDGYTVKSYTAERNGARGPGFFEFDMRLGYGINLQSRRRLEISADLFNLTNRTNFANPSSDQASPSAFLVLTGYSTSYTPRKVQIGARFEF
jgi:hypothetical protein